MTLIDSRRNPWLVPIVERSRPTVRLFCLSHAGGGTLGYRAWAPLLPGHVEAWAVQLPGREERILEPALTSAAEIVPAVVRALRDRTDLPYVLFGHSMGALLGYEIAGALRERGLAGPRHLVVSGAGAPRPGGSGRRRHELSRDGLIQVLRDLGGTPEEILRSPEMMDLVLPTLRADFQVVDGYRYTPRPALDCPITVLGGRADSVGEADLARWAELTGGRSRVLMFDGGHMFVNTERAAVVRAVAGVLSGAVEGVGSAG
ncbi:alpha/beta fold hydrolase [Actinoplanes oblitus]|uniref:Alpha/beta fold hydrolase n=1 Tax=Actinoplanes oblitus TaxID=3040509 RepID=A0ABY8W9C9_9ACTN|nr:alpha/beta fold hydrolase [Actinoplanes oblitus]WIM94405.1 alpha/beta fold hydrolase [Actinoplanes oblitus]